MTDLAWVPSNAPDFLVFVTIGLITMLVATVVAFGYLVLLRLGWERESALIEQIEKDWTPVFNALRRPVPVSIPDVSAREATPLLALWLEQRQIANEAFAKVLDDIALQVGLDKAICALLRTRPLGLNPSARWLSIAIRAARYIDTPETRASLLEMAGSEAPAFAIGACESLLALGDQEGVRLAVGLLFRYPEFDKTITTRLGSVGGTAIIRALDPFLDRMPVGRREDFIYLIERGGDESLLPILTRRLSESNNEEETASLLRALSKLGDERQRDLVLPWLTAEQSFIRVQACRAMGTVGCVEDVPALEVCLRDQNWWVRYRSAQSIIKLVKGDEAALDRIQAEVDDRYAKDVLRHTIDEWKWHAA